MEKEKKKKPTTEKPERKRVTYSWEVALKLCKRIERGELLIEICKEREMPSINAVYLWLDKYPQFDKRYMKAREVRADSWYEEGIRRAETAGDVIVGNDKSDNARVAAVRLYVDTLKWAASRVNPYKYGDKLDVTSKGEKISVQANMIEFVPGGKKT
jgi:hypothetical protein